LALSPGLWAIHLQRALGSRQPKISLVAGLSVNFEAGRPAFVIRQSFLTTAHRLHQSCWLLVASLVGCRCCRRLLVVGGCWPTGGMAGCWTNPQQRNPEMSCAKSLSQSGGSPTQMAATAGPNLFAMHLRDEGQKKY